MLQGIMLSTIRRFSSKHFHVVVAGGGTGGSSSAHNFAKKLGADKVAVIEPSEDHFYQPMWTLVGAGAKKFDQSRISMSDALPKDVSWFKQSVINFDPDQNQLEISNGEKISYDYLIVALGIKLDYERIPGVVDALEHDDRVCSNYSTKYVHKTFKNFENFENDGRAIFTFPNTPVKCAGAPQKIMYLFDDYLRKNKKRDLASVEYHTSLPVIFGVKKYAAKLNEICKERNLSINTRHNLVEVDMTKREATFENLDTKEKQKINYNMLHITPPMRSYDVIKNSKLADEAGFVDVDKETLQHVKYPNVFALGDSSNCPTSKTAAAIAVQQNVVFRNLLSYRKNGTSNVLKYDGYTSCPLVTQYDKCVLAEFDYTLEPLETFPWSQDKESRLSYVMKAHVMPQLYWHGLIKGIWNGPTVVRKLLHLGQSR